MNIEFMNAAPPCPRMCGGITACTTGWSAVERAAHADEADRLADCEQRDVRHPQADDRHAEADQQIAARPRTLPGAARNQRPARTPTSGVQSRPGTAIAADSSAAIRRGHVEVLGEEEVE